MKKFFFLSLSLFLTSLGYAQKGKYYQQYASYNMDIDVDVNSYTYHGKQSVTYTNNSPDELKEVYFHLYWNAFKPNSMMDERVRNQGDNADKRLVEKNKAGKVVSRLASIPEGKEGNQKINWIKQNGKELQFEVQETIMKVYLNQPIKPNSTTTFTMDWDANIPYQIRRAGRQNREGVEMTMTQWYPKLAEYDYDGWATFDYIGREFHAPFSDYNINIKIDPSYVIGAGGTLTNPTEVKGYSLQSKPKTDANGKATWNWTAKNILDFAWAADPDYSVEEFIVPDGPKVYFVYQKNEKTEYWKQAKPYVNKFFQIMNANFGRYVYPSYSFVQGGDGGMEYGMCTMILGEAKSLESLVGLMAHEGAHSWYQQMLATNESTTPWLDEGFTSYAEDFAMYQLFPPKEAWPNPFVGALEGYRKFVKTGKEEPAVWFADHHDDGTAYSVASYTKGELFLVQLGYIMGEDLLKTTLLKYYDEWHLKHPTDRDFLHLAQKISGMDLKWFKHYWINTTKTIDYAIKEVKYNPNSTTITLVKKGGVPMPIDFGVLTKDKKITSYHIPLNMMRTPKKSDFLGNFTTLDYWNWTSLEYTFEIPFTKEQISVLGIDFSQRLADVNPEDNFLEVK
ncbi:M1 family metallopeptidase [Riemerella anatipestifer]|uniref:M1 family metallopeptidase n=1 Tax=Riemerella anatipestifer TaxID=34085 RepID=UPI0012AE3390|nr:M1 family metallopeptidase [Riemerella anatipestifer]USL96350.1 M1 family metallopeptidase [Riemerella anatipestifer]